MFTTDLHIPAEDISRQYMQLKDEVAEAISRVLPTSTHALGPAAASFAEDYARYCQVPYCLVLASGTEALQLALAACEVGVGDEVITVPNTYAAAVFAISYVGATPVFVDIDPATYNIDVAQVETKITPRTKAILPIHLYGLPVDLEPLLAVARRHGLRVIEDCTHAHGAQYQGRRVGSWGDVGCFSFYPRKVLGCYGDGGAVTTHDAALYERLDTLRVTGPHQTYAHEGIGFQQRLDEMQAAILTVKLRHLDRWIELRRRWAAIYTDSLSEYPVTTPGEPADRFHVYYQYTIRTGQRDDLLKYLSERGIGSQVMYPIEIPYLAAYEHLGYRAGDFPAADAVAREILCLPMFPELTEDEVCEVAGAVCDFFS